MLSKKPNPLIRSFERFSATGLLAVAVPALDSGLTAWTIDGALGIARRTEQALHAVVSDDVEWSRVQNAFSHDYTSLLTALTALGHQAQAETTDFGMVVTILYQNRPQRPDLIEASLRDEIAQRQALLTARETEVLENHLQAEVAAAIQRMLGEAEARRNAINAELAKRPTSTGVKFRLDWRALPEGADGAPVGLDAARQRLLNTSFDAWSPQDREVVGTMLQNRITAERMRADGESASLLEMLARALDYRRWHRFRVQRWQDGQWRLLSGPASSGERALGLTVPLFAAVSSFYTHGGSKDAPRLVLLDEALAGIDDAARALHGAGARVRSRLRDDKRTRMGMLCGTARRLDLPAATTRAHRCGARIALALGWPGAPARGRWRAPVPAAGPGGRRRAWPTLSACGVCWAVQSWLACVRACASATNRAARAEL